MKTRIYALLLNTLIAPFFTIALYAQAPAAVSSVFEYLTAKEGTAVQLEFDVTELVENKRKNDYYPANIRLEDGTTLALEVRSRGKFRRRLCEVPPLKMKFAKKELRKFSLDTLNEVRLVLPCTFTPDDEALLLREYLAYRMYEKLSPYHVKARLIRLTLRDRHTEQSRPTVWAILLQHDEELAAKLGGTVVEQFGLTSDSTDTYYTAMNAAFQYMIGNTDWSLRDNRNLYQFRPAQGGKIIPIPYDFDFSGLVDAPYATPTKEYGLTTVRDRALIADGLSERDVKRAIKTLVEHETFLMDACNRAHLDAKHLKAVQQYLGDFFTAVKQYNEVPKKIKAAK